MYGKGEKTYPRDSQMIFLFLGGRRRNGHINLLPIGRKLIQQGGASRIKKCGLFREGGGKMSSSEETRVRVAEEEPHLPSGERRCGGGSPPCTNDGDIRERGTSFWRRRGVVPFSPQRGDVVNRRDYQT